MTNTKRPAAEPGMGNMRSRFRPLAEARLNGVLEKLDYLADMAQRNRYHYTDEEIQILEDAVLDKVADVVQGIPAQHRQSPSVQLAGLRKTKTPASTTGAAVERPFFVRDHSPSIKPLGR